MQNAACACDIHRERRDVNYCTTAEVKGTSGELRPRGSSVSLRESRPGTSSRHGGAHPRHPQPTAPTHNKSNTQQQPRTFTHDMSLATLEPAVGLLAPLSRQAATTTLHCLGGIAAPALVSRVGASHTGLTAVRAKRLVHSSSSHGIRDTPLPPEARRWPVSKVNTILNGE